MTLRVFALALVLAAPAAGMAADASARAVLKDAQGQAVGTATFTPTRGGVKVEVEVAHLTAGKHGIHVHAVGQCEPPGFQSAGGHFNPFGKQHGFHNPEGAHAGDLPNLTVKKDGTAKASFTAKGATLAEGDGSLFGPGGTSLVIHAGPDDEKSDPAGNSGDRIACGTIEKN